MATHQDHGLPELRGLPGCLGYAENFSGQVPAYDGVLLSRAVRKGLVDPWILDSAPVLRIFPCDLDTLKSLSLPTWQGMDYAATGIGRWRGTSVVVYNKQAVMHLLDQSIIDLPPGSTDTLVRVLVNNIYREQMLPACLGRKTPFFFTHVVPGIDVGAEK